MIGGWRNPCARLADRRVTRSGCPRGLSLLEVTLAIAILGGCLAVVGELVRMGSRHAEEAREMTVAQLLAESQMESIVAGILPAQSASSTGFEHDPRWTYTVEVASVNGTDLLEVTVHVQQAEITREVPLVFSLTRWMLDPAQEIELLDPWDSQFIGTTRSSAVSSAGMVGRR